MHLIPWLEHRQELRGVVARGLDDRHALVDDHLRALAVGRRVDRRQDREVDPERLVGQLTAAVDLARERVRGGLRQRGDAPQRAGVRDRGDELGAPDPLHPTLHDGVLNAEHLGESGLQGRAPVWGGGCSGERVTGRRSCR
jgi:hypothetical protein